MESVKSEIEFESPIKVPKSEKFKSNNRVLARIPWIKLEFWNKFVLIGAVSILIRFELSFCFDLFCFDIDDLKFIEGEWIFSDWVWTDEMIGLDKIGDWLIGIIGIELIGILEYWNY